MDIVLIVIMITLFFIVAKLSTITKQLTYIITYYCEPEKEELRERNEK
jgi:hypothetical protein